MLGGKCIASSFHFTPCVLFIFTVEGVTWILRLCTLGISFRLQLSEWYGILDVQSHGYIYV